MFLTFDSWNKTLGTGDVHIDPHTVVAIVEHIESGSTDVYLGGETVVSVHDPERTVVRQIEEAKMGLVPFSKQPSLCRDSVPITNTWESYQDNALGEE